jgi:hypothetical protein
LPYDVVGPLLDRCAARDGRLLNSALHAPSYHGLLRGAGARAASFLHRRMRCPKVGRAGDRAARASSGRVTLKLCNPDGTAGERLFSRRDGAAYKRAALRLGRCGVIGDHEPRMRRRARARCSFFGPGLTSANGRPTFTHIR